MSTTTPESDTGETREALFAYLGELVPRLANEHRVLPKNGGNRTVPSQSLIVRETEGEADGAATSQISPVSHHHAERQVLYYYAFHDALTGLPNRALFMDRLGRAIERAKRHAYYLFAVLFVDFDDFKVVNDTLGHALGDQLLVASTRRLETCLRAADTIARWGGDEFVILLEDIHDASDATRVANRIQAELALPFNLNGHRVSVSASIGIVLSKTGYDRPEEVLRDADMAMYRAKALGKAQHEVFDPAMRARVMERLALETSLRQALERQEFWVYYQPIVALETGEIHGFEALLRWQHPERGLTPPEAFIPVAEESGLIIPIGQWVLREACRQMREWQARFPTDPPLTISVNLSSKQLSQPDLVEQIEQILRETGLDAHCLRLELTENTLMTHAESAMGILAQLRALGVAVQLDDFGTGYSSLAYLHRSPLPTIKVDRSFVSQMDMGEGRSEVVQAIVTLAHNLSMEVIAEGVETAEQLARLKALGCEFGQGYHFSKPLDGRSAEMLIAKMSEKD